tara:strand:- start:404 stop:967 length:564 start_codon:yes stop_codon:yes gene_type:complete
MNKAVLLVFGLLFCGCSVFKQKTLLSKQNIESITIHSNVLVTTDLFANTKIKTKIKIYEDSIIASITPFLGIEMANIKLKDDVIIIDNKLKNEISTINTVDFDSDFKLKKLKKLFVRTKNNRDVELYKTKDANYILTNYSQVNIPQGFSKKVFMPTKIILDRQGDTGWLNHINKIELEYKSIQLNSY